MDVMASQITIVTQPFIQAQIKENIKAPRRRPLCWNSPVTGDFPVQMAGNAENVSIWWRHHDISQQSLLHNFLMTSSLYGNDVVLSSWQRWRHHYVIWQINTFARLRPYTILFERIVSY